MLLLKKKKYAAVVIKEGDGGVLTYEKELKGLDLVRRDWCPMSKDAGECADRVGRRDLILSYHPPTLSHTITHLHTHLSHNLSLSYPLSSGKFVVDQILSGNQREDIVIAIHDYLSDLATRCHNPPC